MNAKVGKPIRYSSTLVDQKQLLGAWAVLFEISVEETNSLAYLAKGPGRKATLPWSTNQKTANEQMVPLHEASVHPELVWPTLHRSFPLLSQQEFGQVETSLQGQETVQGTHQTRQKSTMQESGMIYSFCWMQHALLIYCYESPDKMQKHATEWH